MPIAVPLERSLDKSFENATLNDLLKAPVSALAGISDGDANRLKEAFGIDTVEELGRHHAIRLAVALVDLADGGH